jgi:hypothetical protein
MAAFPSSSILTTRRKDDDEDEKIRIAFRISDSAL